MPFRFEGSRQPIYIQHGKFAKAGANKKARNAYAASGGTLELAIIPKGRLRKFGPSGIKSHHRRKTYHTTRKLTQ